MYSPYVPQYQPYQYPQPQYPTMQQQVPQQQQQPVQQMMTPPTIHAEIVQVDNEAAAAQYPVGAGASQMMIARDDSAIFVKTATPNGQYTLDVFVKRPPAPEAPPFNPSEYLRRDEAASWIAEAVAAAMPQKQTRTRKEETTE